MSGATSSLAGMPGGQLFVAPTWINLSQPAGSTPQLPPTARTMLGNWILLRHIIFAPNLVWLLISLTSYLLFPYDLEAAKSWSSHWVLTRIVVNISLMIIYYSFWELSLYGLQWSNRKFCANVWPTNGKIVHNFVFTVLGTLQWSLWEVAYIRLIATDQLAFMSDQLVLSSAWHLLHTILSLALVPIWRGIHFYFAHRLVNSSAWLEACVESWLGADSRESALPLGAFLPPPQS